ncbi:mitochondrial ribosomal protein L23 [Cristinia sonorae]|uniref:Large ribosomal subunit protein uL23m n=1 Tax=Cristinia sonorae TaxID=1940300 RepID=A0A8K0UUW5_9AGAR|nr:mitochondrial ribosomal protein L23 [Cristinia sonorae]
MQATFRRLYATLPDAAAVARTTSTPRAVRLRRLQKQKEAPGTGESDATPEGLTPSEYARYHRQLAKAELLRPDGTNPTEAEWLEKLNERRSRIRGVKKIVTPDGQTEAQVVAQKIFLPNILFRLVRNHTPPGQPYNPYEATFRIPQSVTKTDIRSYLSAVYGVKTTYIRTDNYLPASLLGGRVKGRAYKRAVVGLVDPFYYPLAVEDMETKEREAREQWLEENFQIEESTQKRKEILLRMTRKGSKDWRWRTGATAQRGNILKRIAEQRTARETIIAETKARLLEARSKGEAVV